MVEATTDQSTTRSSTIERIGVCHIASGDRWAGAEVQIASILRALSAADEIRICAIILNKGRLSDEVQQCGVETAVIPEDRVSFFGILDQAARFLQGKNIQVLHSHRYKENLLAALLARRQKIPHTVRSQHGLPEPLQGWASVKDKFVRQLDRFVARHGTDSIISVSKELSQHIAAYFKTPPIEIIPNGVDTSSVRSSLTRGEAKARLGIPASCLIVGTAGRLEPVKRVDLFLKAASVVARKLTDAAFIIAGDGSELERMKNLAASLGLHDRALFLGHRNDIYDVLRSFDIFALCSDHEGLPTALLEALYLEIAVVARRVGGIGEVVSHGVNGVLVDSDDPSTLGAVYLDVLNRPDERERMARAGPSTVSAHYSSETTARRTASLYRRLIEGRVK